MDPDIACWVRKAFGLRDGHGREVSRNEPLGLKAMHSLMFPEHTHLRDGHHSANIDATVCWFIYKRLLNEADTSKWEASL